MPKPEVDDYPPLAPRLGMGEAASRIGKFRPDPAHTLSAKLHDIYHYCVYGEKLLMIGRETVRNM